MLARVYRSTTPSLASSCDLERTEQTSRTIDDSPRRRSKDLVDQLVTERLADIGGRPQEPNRHALLEDARRARPDAASSRHEHHTAEEWRDPKHTIAWNATNPELFRRLLNHLTRPIPGARYDERIACFPWLRDGGEAMPFHEGAIRNASEVSGPRRNCACGHV